MIRIQTEDFDPNREIDLIAKDSPNIGAIGSFIGIVRAEDSNNPIISLTLEHYKGMTEKMLSSIDEEANRRWHLESSLIVHRIGKLMVGERIVLVVTASAHRAAALESCNFLIDWLKTKAPFWKYEQKISGGQWVDARLEDEKSTRKWN